MSDLALVEGQAGEDLTAVAPERVVDLLGERGAVLLRGFHAPLESFEAFTERFTDRFVVHGAGVRERLRPGGVTQTVTGGRMAICLHREMHFAPFSPEILWFYCDRAPRDGGATTLGDGVRFLAELAPATRAFLETHRLRYRNVWPPEGWPTYFPGLTPDEVRARMPALGMEGRFTGDGSLDFTYVAPAIAPTRFGAPAFANSIDIHRQYLVDVASWQKPGDRVVRHDLTLADGAPFPRDILDEIHEIGARLAAPLAWQPGDALMVDNTRVMHGRHAFPEGEERRLYLRMANWPTSA
jgi:alpha-ketoglutarate-dependent taurine dioxygenase